MNQKRTAEPQPVMMLMLSPADLESIVERAVLKARADESIGEVWTLQELADKLKVSTKTVLRKVERGELVPLQTHPYRFDRSSLKG